jgi:glycine/D-amino acid oxidase-like deaminating enzyme
MQRRTVLELLSGMAIAGFPALNISAQPRRIVIAGGGILGANIAYQLSKRGAAVTLLERAAPASGATANSFAWLNAKKRPVDYFNLSRLGILAWREIDREFGGRLPVKWGGSVEWRADPKQAPMMADEVRAFQAWGYEAHVIDQARLKAMEPNIVPGALTIAAHWGDEGHADPVGVTQAILAQAVKYGTDVQYPAEIVGLEMRSGKLRAVKSSKGEIEADVLVIACGVETPRLATMAGITVPLQSATPGVLAHVVPQERTVDRVILSPLGNIKQKPDGRIVVGNDFGASEDNSLDAGRKMLQTMAAVLPSLGKASLEKMTLGHRPIPKDGRPIVGFPAGRSDIYLTVMHSGMTLGPLVGRVAATEILDGVTVEPLAAYRLERFS